MKRTPTAWREQLDKTATQVLAGKLGRVEARDQLQRWLIRHPKELLHAVAREFAGKQLNELLRRRAAELADQRPHDAAEQLALDILGDVELRIEVGVGVFADLVDCNRRQLLDWQRQARTKRDNVQSYCQRVDDVVARLLPLMTTDEVKVREVLRNVPQPPPRPPSPADIAALVNGRRA